MTEALVRLDDLPQMTLCSICPKPGHCCKSFTLFTLDETEVTFWRDGFEEQAKEYAPFVPTIQAEYVSKETGEPYVSVRWSCPHLTGQGRCGIYETRPVICRRFLPGDKSQLCVFHPENLKTS